MTLSAWCLPCATAVPRRETRAVCLVDGDPCCASCRDALTRPPAGAAQRPPLPATPPAPASPRRPHKTQPSRDEDLCARIRAIDPRVGNKTIARQQGVSAAVVRKIREAAGIRSHARPGRPQPTAAAQPTDQRTAAPAPGKALPAADRAAQAPAAKLIQPAPAVPPAAAATVTIPLELDTEQCDAIFARLPADQQLEAVRHLFPTLALEQKGRALSRVLCSALV